MDSGMPTAVVIRGSVNVGITSCGLLKLESFSEEYAISIFRIEKKAKHKQACTRQQAGLS
jgi:hypothetical protein